MITQAELTILLGDMSSTIKNYDVMSLLHYGQDTKEAFFTLDCMLLDYFVLSNWQQHSDGTTDGLTNYISQTVFDELVSKVKEYATG